MANDGAYLDRRIDRMREMISFYPQNASFQQQLNNLLLKQRQRDQRQRDQAYRQLSTTSHIPTLHTSLAPPQTSKGNIPSMRDPLSAAVARRVDAEAIVATHTRMLEQYNRQTTEATLSGNFERCRELNEATGRRLQMLAKANSKLDEIRTQVATLSNSIPILEPCHDIKDGSASASAPAPAPASNSETSAATPITMKKTSSGSQSLKPYPGINDNSTLEPRSAIDDNSTQLSFDRTNEFLPLDSDPGGMLLRSGKRLCVHRN